ncbi:E3 ubiquitin-protein ligase COP1 [Morella rubra]|uniref:E3 ubiquitin-protein ligase COP1 n=1 Tax=Morella rubra TaxID=262757 RepID=A0A6A1WED1_9ROSI|nr:E3 ubiquitin-protein ligase COP1 [Morella rubra]
MEEVSTGTGPVVPAVVKPERERDWEPNPKAYHPAFSGHSAEEAGGGSAWSPEELDKDLLCPICMQTIKDAFLTACGHSFCYMCIVTHLRNKSDCPCCSNHLTLNHLFPNFLLDKLLKKASARQLSKTASPAEQFRQALQGGCEVSIKEIDTLLLLLSEKKRKMEQEEAERNMQILLTFLHHLRKQKVDELNEVQSDLQFIKEDITSVERHRMELYCARDRYSVKLRILGDDSSSRKSWPWSRDGNTSDLISSSINAHED